MKYYLKSFAIFLVLFFSTIFLNAQNWIDLATFEPDPFETNAYERFGSSLDADGIYAIAGAPSYQGSRGCAYILKNEGGTWNSIARLTASDGADWDQFGLSVAIDNNVVIVGARKEKNKAYLFEMPAGGWADMTETLQLTPHDVNNINFGSVVEIEGDLIAVGSPTAGNGQVYLYGKAGTSWNSDPEIAILSPTTGSSSYGFGSEIAIHGDLIAVGEPNQDNGYVYLFNKPTGGWTNMAPEDTLSFSAAITTYNSLGKSLSICDDYIVAGSFNVAVVFEKPASGWESMTQTAILSGSGLGTAPLENLGHKVTAWDNTIVSAYYYYNNGSINEAGGLYFYERGGDHWGDMTETFIQTASDGEAGDYLGYDIAMLGDTLLASAYHNSDAGTWAGSVYAWARTGVNWSDGTSEQLILPIPDLSTSEGRFGTSAAIDGSTAVIGFPGYNAGEGAAVVLEWDGSQWEKVALLTPSEPQKGARFGTSVDIHQDTIIVGAPYYDWPDPAREDMGLAYLFIKQGTDWSDMNQRAFFYDQELQANQEFGFSVAWDNGTAVVGAPKWDKVEGTTTSDIGLLYIFDNPDLSNPLNKYFTTNKHLFTSEGGENHMLGNALCMNGTDISASAIGANSGIGAVYVFEDKGPAYNGEETAILTPSDGTAGDNFGQDIDTDGPNIIVGAPEKDNPSYNTGGAYVYVKNTNWTTGTETAIITPSVTNNKNWGKHVAIDGSVALISGGGTHSVLACEASNWSSPAETGLIEVVTSYSGSLIEPAIDLDNNTAVIGYPGYSGTNDNAGMVTLFERFSYPATQAGDIAVSSSSSAEINIGWTNGSGDGHLVFMKASGSGSPVLTDNTSYTANTEYGSGTAVDGWFCVFNGTGPSNEVDITGLSPETTYRIAVYSFNGENGNNLIMQDDGTNNPVNFTTGIDLSVVGYHVANGQLTNTTAGMEYEIAGSGIWTTCNNGTTEGVSFAEGTVIVRQASDQGNTFIVAELSQPAAPAITIDYVSETTGETIGSSLEYNEDNDFGTANTDGTGAVVIVVPGTDLYFRYKATGTDLPSDVQTLVVPNRPVAPAVSIDYLQEQTSGSVPDTLEYAEDSGFSTGTGSGDNTPLPLTPGTELWFRVSASNTGGYFYGQPQQLIVPERGSAPSFGINYEAETTLEVIPDTVEYAADADFTSGVGTGNGTNLEITPNTVTWFRYKASNIFEFFSSEAQQFATPDRPAVTNFTIDYQAETTVENIPDTVEYAEDDGFSTSLQSGDGSPVKLIPGINMWFRAKASNTNQHFAGTAQALTVPTRPNPPVYTIKFTTEYTYEAAPSYIQWAEDADFTINTETGNGGVIYLTPGTSLYIRRLARPTYNQFKSEAFFLEVPPRPSAPIFTIDYPNEKTNEAVPDTILYNGGPGQNEPVSLTPGTNVNFQIAAAEPQMGNPGNFAGEVFTLEIDDRPAIPAFEIDYLQEQTTEVVADTVEYRINYSPTIQTGEGIPITLEPGTTVSLRYIATTTHFRSLEQNLMVPGRPQTPAFSINYLLEETNETLPSTMEYSNDGGTTFMQGDGNPLMLTPGSNYIFRYMATSTQFHGTEQHLDAPERAAAPTNPVLNDDDNTFDWTFVTSYESTVYYEFSTNAGDLWEPCVEKPLNIGNVNLSAGDVMVRVAASNQPGLERFYGNTLASETAFTMSTGILSREKRDIVLYPNPAKDFLKFKMGEECKLESVRILSISGKVLLNIADIHSSESINISKFSPGLYIVEVKIKSKVFRKSMIKR